MKSQLVFLFWMAFAGTALAASEPMLQKNPLEKLPSKPGPHIEKIKAMKPGSWLDLGSPAADPKWGRARGRSWGGHAMVPAPEFRGTMFTGEGKHGWVKVYPIDPAANKVLKPIPLDAKFNATKRVPNAAFYDPTLAVTFIFTAGDSADNGRMWVHKYGGKRANGGK